MFAMFEKQQSGDCSCTVYLGKVLNPSDLGKVCLSLQGVQDEGLGLDLASATWLWNLLGGFSL